MTVGDCEACGLSLSLRRAWIEIYKVHLDAAPTESLSLRRAWIEIVNSGFDRVVQRVALLTESVD